MTTNSCPVCESGDIRFFAKNTEGSRSFFLCPRCYYLFEKEGDKKITLEEEKRFFNGQWEESPDGGNSACYPTVETLIGTSGAVSKEKGGAEAISSLDYGCGGGGLIRRLRAYGINAFGIDRQPVENDMKPFVFTDLEKLPDKKFSAITLIEVMEHLHDPLKTLESLLPLLADDGFFFITTALTNRSLPSLRFFPYWVYQNDDTHVGFFHERTFEWISEKLKLDLKVMEYGSIVLDRSFKRVIVPHEGAYGFASEGEEQPNWPLHKP